MTPSSDSYPVRIAVYLLLEPVRDGLLDLFFLELDERP